MIRYYFMPLITLPEGRGAAYLSFPGNTGLDVPYTLCTYGAEDICLAAADVSTAQHDSLVAHSDVMAAPQDIDNNPSAGAVISMQTFLENINIPSDWVSTSLTYREILRAVLVMFQLMQKFCGLQGGKLFESATLSTQYNQLPIEKRQALQAMAAHFSLDTSGLSGTSTLRDFLQTLRSQLSSLQVQIGGDII